MVVYRRSGWGETNDNNNNNTPYYQYTLGQIVYLAPDGTEHTLGGCIVRSRALPRRGFDPRPLPS